MPLKIRWKIPYSLHVWEINGHQASFRKSCKTTMPIHFFLKIVKDSQITMQDNQTELTNRQNFRDEIF